MVDPLWLVSQLLPPRWEHPKTETLKTQTFYEFILVDIDSILVTHMPCSQDWNRVGYSKVVIKQILTPSQWRAQPWITRNFSQTFEPQFYNYYDYMEAWDRFLLFQDNIYRHTWFFDLICIERKTWWYQDGSLTCGILMVLKLWFSLLISLKPIKFSRKNQTYRILKISHIFWNSFTGFQISHGSSDGNKR